MMTLDTDGSFMAKELEAEDIELKEYSFTPKEIWINGITVLDYTEVENDKVFLCNKKDILDKPRPSWIPELDSKGLAIDKFLPICVKDFSDGNYFVQSKIYTGERDTKGVPIYKKQIYKMSPDVLAATVDYYLKRKRAELKTEGSSEKVSLPRGMNSMPTSRYNEISKLCLLCDVPSLKYKNVDKSITDKAFEMKGKSPGKLYQIQNNVVFLEQWQPLLENIKGKRLDMNYQKQDYIDSYSKAVETAYGDSKTFNNLYNDFGVKIKKQNGTNFSKPEIEKLSETLKKVYAHYGNLSELAGEYGLKISYADNCMQFARKAIGLYFSFHNAIGISFFNEEKQLSVAGINHLPDVTLAHEVAHWLDSQKGKESHNFFASDKYGTLENQIATKFKEEIKFREKSNKSATRIGKADEIHLGEYWHRTCECFARAMEQYYALKQGIDLSEEIAYARKDNFEEDFIPLIEELMEENKRHFGINDISHGISNSSVPELLKPNLKDLKKYSESYAKIINEENAVLKTKPDTFNYLRGANKSMDNKVYAYHEKMLRIGIKKTALEIQLKIAARLPFSKNELSEYEKTDVCNIDKESISLMDKNTFEYFTTVINSVLLNGGYKPKREFPFVLRKESGEVNFWKLKIDEEDNTQVISASINTMAKEEFHRIEEQNTKVKGEYLLAAEEEFLRREEPYKVVDAYSISTKSIYDNVIKRLDSEGYVCRTQLKLSEYRTPSFSELDEYIKENSKKYQPVIVLFDEYNDYDKTTNEYKTIKAWQIYDKESLEDGTYISLGKCKINYLNENLELEYKGPFVAPGSQITARSYYNSKGTRELCHIIKEADRNSEEYKNAIEKAASYIAEHIHKSRHTYLVPAPNHNGKAEYTYDIARIVGLKINAPVFNILECKPHETLYEQKKKNLEPDVELFLNDYGKSVISNFPEDRNYIYLIDNCISTGLTFNKAAELINGLIPAVYAIGNFAEVKYVNEKYKVNNLLELKNEITHEENKLMENKNESTEMTQAEKDSQFLMETYGNKKAVDAACKKASISDFVSTDKNRLFMNGIFYEKGFAVATDGRMLIKLKKDYPSEWEGKIIDPNTGKEIEGQFPSYEKVFPNKELLKDRSDRLAHISNYLSEATAAIAISEKTKRFENIVPVMFDNTFVNPRHLQLALSFARDKNFNKVLQEDNYKIDYEPVLDENGKEVYKYYKVGESSEDNLAHKYYTLDELPEDVKKAAYEKIELVGLDNLTNIHVENGELWSYDKVEEKKIVYETNLEKPLSRVIEFDAPDGSSILIMPAREPEGPYIDKDGILKNYEDITFIKTKLLGKDEELHKNIVRTLINESDFSDVDVDSIYKKNLEEALAKLNPDVFPKNKKDCQILATVTTYTDVIGENLDRKDFIFEQGQNTATLQQFVCNLWLERFKDYSAHPEHLFVTGENLNPKNTLKMAAEKNIIKEKELDFEQLVQNEFGDALKAQENEKNVQEISKYSFIVKDNSEYGSDFEPVKNLSATEAVRLFQKLNESDISENRFGIALHIPGDKVFGEWAEEGISIVTLDDTEKANFSIYGDSFITQLKESDDRSRTYIDAYKDLYNALEQSSKENFENYGVVYPDFLFKKEKELFSEHSVNENKTIEIKPVTLEEILDVMDMRPDYKENGSFMIYDIQKQEYISSWVGWEDDNGAAVFKDASEAFERLDIYINDYYIHDMQEQLEAVGVEISGNETLSDLCNLYKAELEKGNTKLSEGELNLAMGIVEPDTVTYEHKLMKEKSLEKDETNELRPTFTLFASASEERITELKEHLSQNGYDVKWIQIEDSSVPRFTCDIDSKAYIQTILEERGIDYSYKLGLLASGYDASWLTEDEQLDAEVVTEEEFKRINEIREKEFKDLKLPYIKIDFTEGTTSSHKPAMMESGTVLGLKEGEELLNELNRRFNTFLKCDVSVNFPDAKDNEPGSYSLRYDFHDDKRTLENGKEVSFEREGLSDYIRMTCSYPEVLEKYEQQWQKVNAPNITEEQKKLVADIVEPNYEKLKEAYIQHCKTLKPILEGDKKVHSSWIINKDVSDVSKSSVEKEKESIAVSFERYAGICINHIADYLNENKELSFKDEFISYAGHQISNMLQNVKYGESRNAKYGEHGYDFDFSLWRSSLEKVMDASEYNSYFTERLMAEEKRYKEIKNTAKDMGMNSEKNFDFTSLADRICQNGFEASASGFDYNFDFSEIAEMAGKNESWVKENLHEICEALTGHNDELLLDFNENEALSEDGTIHLNFCSVGEDYNELFKKGDDGRWIRKTDDELRQEHLIDDEIDKGIESIQANGGMSEAALEAEYEAQLREQEMELDDEPEEALPVWPINGEAFFESEIEESLKADVEELFRQYDSGETEKNLTLVGVKMYRDPTKDGKISLLVEFDSKNPENRWREDSLFNALNEEGIEFNGMKVDFNPITKEKSGTIEQYLKQLEGFGNEEEVIKENARKLEEKEIENKLNDISNRLSEIDSDEQRILPFSIFENKEKGRINIKFDTAKINRDILKELKAHGWKYAASTKQWYPVGNAVKTASDFANRLQEKYSETRNPNMEKPMDLGPEKSPYDGIRFFDRNYNESEDFAKFFNSNIHLFKKGKESAITEEDAATILKAIGYEKVGIVEQRKLRVGLDNKDKIVILTSENGNVKTEKIELSDILEFAKNKAEERVIESKQMLQNYLGKEPVVKKDLQDIFISLYETCVTQSEEIDSKMKLLYDSFIGKKHEQVKEAVLYQRNSYRGWEISTDKDFKKSVYCRPFEQTDRSGYILMAGKEGKDGFWQEKFVREMLKSNNWSERGALIETLTTLASDKETCTALGIKEPQSLNGFFSSLDKIIHVENDTDIKNELMESLLGPSEAHKVSKESTKELSVGDKLGEDTVSDLFWISDGVCQATLSREVNGVGSAQNYFVIDNSIINQLDEELKELVVSFDSKSVIENKSYEPYILKELIKRGLMPPRDEDFIQQLDEYISVHPLKYEKLKPVDYLNFERKLQEIAEVDKAFNKTPFELGQQLIALVDESDRERLNIWLRKQGCDSKEHMAEVFDSWLNNKEQKKDITQKKNNGYPPRGEQ